LVGNGTMKTSRTEISSAGDGALERISSLVDGELDRAEVDTLVPSLCADAALLQKWRELHRVGDALRSTEVAAFDDSSFCAKVSALIAAEPTVLAPRRSSGAHPIRRSWVPGVAVAASIAAIGFIAVPLLRAPEPIALAQKAAPAAAVATATAEPVRRAPAAIANARALDAYFSAHRELTGGSAMPRAAAYLRPIASEDR
jgi:sigma-E factor negative regulatory protein RseA